MVRDEERFVGCGSRLTTWGVLLLTSKAVGQGSLDVFLLSSLQVLLLPAPGLQSRGLQGSAIRESQSPWLQQWALVDGIEVDGRLFLALPPDRKVTPVTARGTVRRRAVTVAMAISSLEYFWVQAWPGVTKFGFSNAPSR